MDEYVDRRFTVILTVPADADVTTYRLKKALYRTIEDLYDVVDTIRVVEEKETA